MVRRGIFIGILLWLVVSSAYAQEDEVTPTATTTPDGTFITEYSANVLLPSVIRLRAKFAVNPRDFESANLTLFQASGFERTIPINLETDLIGEGLDFITVQIDEPLEGEDAPRLFEPLSYRWGLTTQDDKNYTVSGEVLVQPFLPNITWQLAGEAPLIFYTYNENLGVAILRENLLTVYDLLEKQLETPRDFTFVLFEREYPFCKTKIDEAGKEILVTHDAEEYPCSIEAYAEVLAQNDLRFILRSDTAFDTLESQLLREMIGTFYDDYWTVDVPAWFREGLILLYRPYLGLQELAIAEQANTSGNLFPLAALDAPPNENLLLWQSQSYLLLLYLADTYGANAPFELASALNEAENFEDAVENLTGMDLTNVYRAWKAWLTTQNAERAAAWNPYLQTTPTNTPTSTVTPIPPTQTPSNTPTPSMTPTATSVSGRDVPTALAPATVTLTLAVTASNTPLPPGSLPTALPTATPPVSSENDDNGGGGLPCGTAAIALPAIIFAVSQRKKR